MMQKEKSVLTSFFKVFIAFIGLPIIIINIFIHSIYSQVILEKYQQQSQQYLNYLGIGIENELRNRFLMATTIAYDEGVRQELGKWLNEDNEYMKKINEMDIDQYILNKFDYMNMIHSITIYMRDGQLYQYKKNTRDIVIPEPKSKRWYIDALQHKDRLAIISENDKYLSLVMGLDEQIGDNKDQRVEVIRFSFHTNIFDSFYSQFSHEGVGDLVIAEPDGQVVSTQIVDLEDSNLYEENYMKGLLEEEKTQGFKFLSKHDKYVSIYRTPKNKWFLVNIIDKDQLFKEVNRTTRLANIIYIVMIALYIVITTFFFRSIILPIKKLIRVMKVASAGQLPEVSIKGCGEIKLLEKQFYSMLSKIHTLIEETRAKEVERSKEEVRALQAQINPHFIYNTLNSIRLMAMMAGKTNIKNMTDAFMKVLGSTFRNTNNKIKIREEIEILNNYIYIMKVRYNDGFRLDINVQEEILDLYIMKLIFQPIVENSITYGINSSAKKLVIAIKGYRENDKIIFKIVDNGCGMSEEKINKIMKADTQSTGNLNSIGISNINRRIRLNYGDAYGIQISSKEGYYTAVQYTLPYIMLTDEKDIKN